MNTEKATPAKAAKASNTLVTVTEVAEQVGREILESRLEPGAWATALYESGGKRQDALALYARLRVRKLTKQHRIRLAKNRSFESRRLTQCMGDKATRDLLAKTIQEMLESPKRGATLNFVKPKLSLIWLFVLFIGTAGCAASIGRLFIHHLPDSFAHPVTLVALLAGVGSVWGALVVRYVLPKRWIMLCWNSGLVVTCNIVCLGSLFLGTKVIKHAIATDAAVFPLQQAASPLRNASSKPATAMNSLLVSTEASKTATEN